jgi:uncharacterized protein with HEPN domain
MSRDEAYLLDMLIAARRAHEVVQDITYDQFKADWKQSSAVIHQLTILGEAVKRLSSEFREQHQEFPWKAIAGQRDILIHQYNEVDLHQVWIIATKELPPLIEFLETAAPSK